MRKNQQKSLLSPKPKYSAKSPISWNNAKVTSPIHSYRPASRSNKKISRLFRQSKPEAKAVWVPNPMLYSFIHPLEKILRSQFNFYLQMGNKHNSQKIWVISNIDSFAQTYMELADEMKVQCQKWFIISKAVNRKQTEEEFNQHYSPIKFTFMPTISSVFNELLNYQTDTIQHQVFSIYDLGLKQSQKYLSVRETLIQNIVLKPNSLYIISDAKQWMMFCSKIPPPIIPYFLMGTQQFQGEKITIKQLKNYQSIKSIYVLFQFEISLDQIKGFQSFQASFAQKMVLPQQIENIEQNQVYLRKLIQRLLVPQQKVCLFYEPLSKSALFSITQLRQKLPSQFFIFKSQLFIPAENCYQLKWNYSTKQCQKLSINTAAVIEDQIKKIQGFIYQKINLAEQFKHQIHKLRKMQIFFYDKQNKDKQNDKSLRHCISHILKKNDIKIGLINDLDCLVETHKITLIYGYFTYLEIKSVQKFFNVVLVPISKQPEEIATFSHIEQAKMFLEAVVNSHSQFYSNPEAQPIQCFIHLLYQTQQNLNTLFSALNIPQQLLKTQYIPNFFLELTSFRQNSRHLIITSMEIFSEKLQSQIRDFQWKFNTIVVDVYLKYGNQFIERSKDGGYKFIKRVQLQKRIDEIIQHINNNPQNKKQGNKQPKLEGLEEIQQMGSRNDELENLYIQQSSVSLYSQGKPIFDKQKQSLQVENRLAQYKSLSMNTEKMNPHSKENKKDSSLIQLLSDSLIDHQQINQLQEKSKLFKQQSLQQQESRLFLGKQTKLLIQHSDFNSEQSKSKQINGIISKRDENPIQLDIQDSKSLPGQQNQGNRLQIQQRKQPIRIKQYNHNFTATLQAVNSEDQILKPTAPQFYKLYIFIHRSVPHYSFARRSKKDYHILLYTRLQQVLVFIKYLKQQQKVVVVANQQSRQIYNQLVAKAGTKEDKLNIVYSRDLSENFIRMQIDKILSKQKLNELPQNQTHHKSFKAIVIYAANNQRAQRAIKIVKKIIGLQIKLYFLKEKQYEELLESNMSLKMAQNIKVYRIGSNQKQGEYSVTSIRSLFILAMHPDLKGHSLDLSNLQFSIQAYLGRLIYGPNEKNYIISSKQVKAGEKVRTKLLSMRSEGNFFKAKQSSLSHLKSEHSSKRVSNPNNRRLNMTRSSRSHSHYRHSATVSVIVSSALQQYCQSNLGFQGEQELVSQILMSYSSSKLAIVVITQRQFDMFQIFQSSWFQQLSKQTVWVVQTKTQGKQVFVGSNFIFSTNDKLKQAVENITSEYRKKTCFQHVRVQSSWNFIKSEQFSKQNSKQHRNESQKTLKIKVIADISQLQAQKSQKIRDGNTLIAFINNNTKISAKLQKNIIQFPTQQSAIKFCQVVVKTFENNSCLQLNQNLASLILVPQKQAHILIRSRELLKKNNVLVKAYDPQNLCSAVCYSIFRTMIIVSKQNEYFCLRKCPYGVQLENSLDKIDKLLAQTLI